MTTDPGSGLPASGPPAQAGSSQPGDAEASDRLQAMLAQASQGQLDEQREISSALGELRGQLQRLSQEIAELRAAPAGEALDGGSINNVTVEVREAVRFLSERLDGVTRMVAQRGEELADVRTALTAIDAHVRSQAETLGVLSTGMQALPSYGERVSGLHEQLETVAQRLAGVEAAVSRPAADSGVNNRLAAIEASITPLSQQLASSGQVAAEHGAALADATASLQALHTKVESVSTGTQAALASAPTFDDSALTSLDQRLAAVAADLTSLSQEVATLVGGAGASDGVSSDDLDRAMRETEQRLRGHVDDAVLALAEALLRPRAVAAPAHVAPADVEPSVFATVSAPAWAPEQPASEEHEPGESEAEGPESGEPEAGQQWWEREDVISPAPSAPAVSVPAIPALDEDLHTPEAGAIDFSQAEMADEDDEEDDEDDDATEVSHFDIPPVQADEGVTPPAPVVPSLPPVTPPVAPPAPGRSEAGGWSPELPAGRPDGTEIDPGTIVPERKRRFFGRDKR